jgi:hypothetical protein
MYVYIYMYIYICIYTHTHPHKLIEKIIVCMHACINLPVGIKSLFSLISYRVVHICIYIYIYRCMYIYTHIYMYVRSYVCIILPENGPAHAAYLVHGHYVYIHTHKALWFELPSEILEARARFRSPCLCNA